MNKFCLGCGQIISFSKVQGFSYHQRCFPKPIPVKKERVVVPVADVSTCNKCGKPTMGSDYDYCQSCWLRTRNKVRT